MIIRNCVPFSLLAAIALLLDSCCSKESCPVETAVSQITFHNFGAGELDAIQIQEYAKGDTAFSMPTDSFSIMSTHRPVGEEVTVNTPKSITLEHNYRVYLQRNHQTYRITALQLTERECAVGCLQPGIKNYKGFGQYQVNGQLQQTDRLRIYR